MNLLLLSTFSLASIEAWIIALLPALTAVGTILLALYKIIRLIADMKSKYSSLEQAVNDKTELTAVKNEMNTIIQQNAVLRKELSDLITATGKVKYNEPTDKEI